jgi:hypothetical protein
LQDIVYGTKHNHTLRAMMRRPNSLNQALATYAIATALSSIAKQSAVERSEVVNNRTSMGTPYDTANNLDTGFLIALQSGSLNADHVMSLTDDESAIIKEHQDVAAKLVQMNVKLIDGSLPDTDIITLMMSSTIGAFDGGNVVIFYDVKASGEDADQPATCKALLRMTHLDRSIKLALHSRTPNNLRIRDSDFFVLMDAGRGHDRDTLIGSLKDDTGKAMPPSPSSTTVTHCLLPFSYTDTPTHSVTCITL